MPWKRPLVLEFGRAELSCAATKMGRSKAISELGRPLDCNGRADGYDARNLAIRQARHFFRPLGYAAGLSGAPGPDYL